MLELVRKSRKVQFNKSIVISEDSRVIKECSVKHLVYDEGSKQIFIITENDFLIICKPDHYSAIEVFPKYCFMPLPEDGKIMLFYYKLLNIPIYTKNVEFNIFSFSGYNFTDDKNGETVIGD